MRPVWLSLLLMTLTVTVLVACGGSPSAGSPSAGPPSAGSPSAGPPSAGPSASPSLSKTVDGIRFNLALEPTQLRSDQNTVVEVSLADSKGKPLSDAQVVVSQNMNMPFMEPNIATAESKGNGMYAAVLNPGMIGDNYIDVTLDWQGQSYQARFDNLSVE